MCALGDILQSKVDKLRGYIKGVKTYINDNFVLIKEIFYKYIEQIRFIFGRLRDSGFKVNAHNCSLGLKDVPYLGCVITRDGIKSDAKEVKGVVGLRRPTTKT